MNRRGAIVPWYNEVGAADQRLDSREQSLLKELQDMLANGAIKRVGG